MRVTITVEHEGTTLATATQVENDSTERGVDGLLIAADRSVRKMLELPDHYKRALRFATMLPHPKSAVLASWREGPPRTLSEFVDDLHTLVSPGSIDGPDPGDGDERIEAIVRVIRRTGFNWSPQDDLPRRIESIIEDLKAQARTEPTS